MINPAITIDQYGNTYSITIDGDSGAIMTMPVANVTPVVPGDSALALISSALRLIGVIASGEPVDAAMAADSLMALNQMIDGWNADRLMIFTTSTQDFPLVAGKQKYTLGIGGDFNAPRPARVNSMSAILLENPSNPIEVPMAAFTTEQWQTEMPVKTVPGSFPQVWFDDGGYPVRTISMWPIPTTSIDNVRIYAWQGLGMPATQDSLMIYPQGYAEAFRFNLAVRLAAEFAAPVPPVVQAVAVQTMARLKTINAPELLLQSDLQVGPGGYSYRADLFGLGY